MKKILFSLLVFATALVANADVLYWMVSDANAAGTDDSSGYYAYLKASTSSDGSNAVTLDSRTAAAVADAAEYTDQFQYTVVSPYGGTSPEYYFFVELANGKRTDPTAYSNLSQYIYSGGLSVPSSLATGGFGQAGNPTYSVPEPTSGLLFVIGGMLLGLKRKRQV